MPLVPHESGVDDPRGFAVRDEVHRGLFEEEASVIAAEPDQRGHQTLLSTQADPDVDPDRD